MYWQNPEYLRLLWSLPLLAALLLIAQRRRRKSTRELLDPRLAARLLPPLDPVRPWVRGGLWMAGVACLILAAARPRFGEGVSEYSVKAVDMFVLLDVSRSMDAQDVYPSRLERAKSDVRDLLGELPDGRIGLISFSGAAVVEVPLTTDREHFRLVLNSLDTQSARRGGTLIGDAIRKAIVSFPDAPERERAIVLITDGEDHESFPRKAARQAAEHGVTVFAVGLGDTRLGGRIPLDATGGVQRYLKDEDQQEVWSRMNEPLLAQIAFETGGAFVAAGTKAYDLGEIYRDRLVTLARDDMATRERRGYADRFGPLLVLGLALLLVEVSLSHRARKDRVIVDDRISKRVTP